MIDASRLDELEARLTALNPPSMVGPTLVYREQVRAEVEALADLSRWFIDRGYDELAALIDAAVARGQP